MKENVGQMKGVTAAEDQTWAHYGQYEDELYTL
jgi:hypothetical protein